MPELPPTPVKNDHPEMETEILSRVHLQSTPTMNFEHPEVQVFLKNVNIGANSRENVVRLYYAVRDSIRYDPYTIELSVEGLRASKTIAAGRGWAFPRLSCSQRSVVQLEFPPGLVLPMFEIIFPPKE